MIKLVFSILAFLPFIAPNAISENVQQHPFMYPVANNGNGKIVGGEQIRIEEAPYTGSLQSRNQHICGVVILSRRFCLTAAHCTDGALASNLQVRVGSSYHRRDGKLVQVERIIQHRSYSRFSLDYDFSLLELEKRLKFSAQIQKIELPKSNHEFEVDTRCIVSGWGSTQDVNQSREQLRSVNVPKVSRVSCHEAYRQFNMPVTLRMMCAGYEEGGRDACQGDSGGPITHQETGVLIGIVSWGFGCAQPRFPGVYARVAAVIPWIKDHIEEEEECSCESRESHESKETPEETESEKHSPELSLT